MIPDRSRALVVLLPVSTAMAILVGLVRSGGRASAPPPSHEVRSTSSELESNVRTPLAPTPTLPSAPERPAAAATTVAPAEARHELPRLQGLVLRPDGDRASTARVVLGSQQARCDALGRFELVLAEDLGAADLLAFEAGYEPVLRPAFGAGLAAGRVGTVELVLGPETLGLGGNVIDREGHPLKGWTVELDGPDLLTDFGLRERVRTDADGYFLIPDLCVGLHVLRAWKDARDEAVLSIPAAAGEDGLLITVDVLR